VKRPDAGPTRLPADDLTDPAPATSFAHLDATTVLSRDIAAQARRTRPIEEEHREPLRRRLWLRRRDQALAIVALALSLRLAASLLMANTYDADEFVYLALGRDVAHGD